jgi:DNA-binding NarL/FixJ family response regulator
LVLGVLVIDDHSVFAEALARALEAQPGVSAATAVTYEAEQRASETNPFDVIVVDAGGGKMNVLTRLLEAHPRSKGVALLEWEDPVRATEAVRAGALAVLPKSAPLATLLKAIQGVAVGEAYLAPSLLGAVLTRLREEQGQSRANSALFNALTRREREVLRLMMDGLDRPGIARELYASVNTIRTHSQSLRRKLGVHSGIEAVSLARRSGWILGSDPGTRRIS